MAESDKIGVTFSCKVCGASPTTLTLPDNHTDDSMAVCKACGAEVGRYGDIKAEAKRIVVGKMRAEMKRAFRGNNLFKGK